MVTSRQRISTYSKKTTNMLLNWPTLRMLSLHSTRKMRLALIILHHSGLPQSENNKMTNHQSPTQRELIYSHSPWFVIGSCSWHLTMIGRTTWESQSDEDSFIMFWSIFRVCRRHMRTKMVLVNSSSWRLKIIRDNESVISERWYSISCLMYQKAARIVPSCRSLLPNWSLLTWTTCIANFKYVPLIQRKLAADVLALD